MFMLDYERLIGIKLEGSDELPISRQCAFFAREREICGRVFFRFYHAYLCPSERTVDAFTAAIYLISAKLFYHHVAGSEN